MKSTLPLAGISAILFLMLWFCYETKPQEVTLWLMGYALAVFLISVIVIVSETRRVR